MTPTDKATRAYAAITAQLSQFDNDDSNEFGFKIDENDFDMSMDDDDDDDDDGFNTVMMIGGRASRGSVGTGTNGNNNVGVVDDNETGEEEEREGDGEEGGGGGEIMNDPNNNMYGSVYSSTSNQRFSIGSATTTSTDGGSFNSVVRGSLGFSSGGAYTPTTAPTFANDVTSSINNKKSEMMERSNSSSSSTHSGHVTTPTPSLFDNSKENNNAINDSAYLESLDGDYRPYHEALQSFITNESNLYNNNNNNSDDQRVFQNKLKSIQLQYMHTLMRSNYDRSTLIQQNDESMEYISTTRHLEKEGHFWSLLIQLLEQSPLLSSSSRSSSFDHFIFWNQNLAATTTTTTTTTSSSSFGGAPGGSGGSSTKMVDSQSLSKMIHSFIKSVVNDNVEIDPAQMVQVMQSYFEEEEDEYDDDNHNSNHGKNKQPSLPPIVKRRQVILAWIESCHNRSISGLDILNLHQAKKQHGGGRKDKIMWRDTLAQLKTNLSSSSSSNIFGGATSSSSTFKDKIDTFHPDAPIQLQMKSKNRTINTNPLYGNDGATETYLLSTFLSLLKAGRIDDAFELCREYGQSWRVAAWNGNGPHGYEEIVSYDEISSNGMDVDDKNDDDDEKKMILIGNPQRSFWKRSLWHASQSMHSLLLGNQTDKQILASGSLVYEAAITSILADDTSTAFKNPIFKRHWMDMIWVYYKSKQSRFMEEIYCAHNDAKRSSVMMMNDVEGENMLPEGTEFEQEEKEQLSSTEEISLMNDEVFLQNLEQKYVDRDVEDDIDLSWRPGMCAFLSGMKDAKSYLLSNIESLLANAKHDQRYVGGDNGDPNQYDQEALLRFIFHLVFLLDSLSVEDENLVSFREDVILPYRNDLLHLYVKRLTMYKPLWKFTCLYASLLPMDEMVDTLTDFWLKSIHDDKSRRVILNQARGSISEGLDLVILRKVVRQSIYPSESDFGSLNMVPPAIMKKLTTSDQSLHKDDLIKIHSIHWLCIFNEHFADALVCVNMLLRQLLIKAGQDGKEDEIGDWSNDVKLHTAKTLTSRLLPQDLIQKAINGGGISDNDENNVNETDANKMCAEEFQSYRKEFESIISFLDAHSAYEAWKDVIMNIPATAEFICEGKFEEGSLENEIAIKMEKRNYIQNKRKKGLALIQIAEASYQKMIEVLEGGFLYSRPTEAGVVYTLDEMRQRSEEMKTIQLKCIPIAMFLTYRILTETAQWMDEFVEDIMNLFKGDASDILARIHMIGDDDESISPYSPTSWHARASMLANLINDDDTLSACFSQEEIEYFQSLMDETAMYLQQCEERQI